MADSIVFSDDLVRKLQSIEKTSTHDDNAIDEEWLYLQECEVMFIDFMNDQPLPLKGDLEYAPVLYLLH